MRTWGHGPEILLDAVLDGDVRGAWASMDEAVFRGATIGDLYADLIEPALVAIDDRVARRGLDPARAKAAALGLERVMSALALRLDDASMERGVLVAACPEGEAHTLGLRMVCDVLERAGWRPRFLGPVGDDELVHCVRRVVPDLVLLSASSVDRLPDVARTVDALRRGRLPVMPVVGVGGRAFREDLLAVDRVGADFTAWDAAETLIATERYLLDHRAAG